MDLLLRCVGRNLLAVGNALIVLLVAFYSVQSVAASDGWRLDFFPDWPAGACFVDEQAACYSVAGDFQERFRTCKLGGNEYGPRSCDLDCPVGQQRNAITGLCVPEGCPEGQEEFNGQCLTICTGTRDPVTGHCDNQCGSKAQNEFGANYGEVAAFGYVCHSGCVASCAIAIRRGNDGDGSTGGAAPMSCWYTGSTCTSGEGESGGDGSQLPAGSDQPYDPETGEAKEGCGEYSRYGVVGGVAGCYATGPQEPTSTISTSHSNSTSTTTGSEGSSTTETESTTTTTTSTIGWGGGGGSGSGAGPQCVGKSCGTSSDGGGGGAGQGVDAGVHGGRCDRDRVAPPDCISSMDAVQCGIFLETWYSRCDDQLRSEQLFGTPESLEGEDTVIGESEANTVPTESRDFAGVVGSVLNGSLFVMPSTCPTGHTFTFMGATITIEFTWVCEFATAIRPFVIALGYLVGLLSLLGGVTREVQ